MEYVELVITLYHLVIRAIAVALDDAEFEADWAKLEAELKKLGIDIPDLPGQPPASGASFAGDMSSTEPKPYPAPVPPVRLVDNGDGTISLGEG